MTRPHRAAHAWLWMLLAITLPVVFVLALQVKPQGHPENAIPQAALDALGAPAVATTATSEDAGSAPIEAPGQGAPAAEPAGDGDAADGPTPTPEDEGGR